MRCLRKPPESWHKVILAFVLSPIQVIPLHSNFLTLLLWRVLCDFIYIARYVVGSDSALHHHRLANSLLPNSFVCSLCAIRLLLLRQLPAVVSAVLVSECVSSRRILRYL